MKIVTDNKYIREKFIRGAGELARGRGQRGKDRRKEE